MIVRHCEDAALHRVAADLPNNLVTLADLLIDIGSLVVQYPRPILKIPTELSQLWCFTKVPIERRVAESKALHLCQGSPSSRGY